MKKRFIPIFLLLLPFAACIKTYIPIPKPPGTSGGSTGSPSTPGSYGVSATVNGKFVTFNSSLSVDTSQNGLSIVGWGDSIPYTNYYLDLGCANAYDPLILGIYNYQPDGTPRTSAFTLYTTYDYVKTGFCAYDAQVTLTNITDSTITGTFTGTAEAKVVDSRLNVINYDSLVPVTNGKFYLHK